MNVKKRELSSARKERSTNGKLKTEVELVRKPRQYVLVQFQQGTRGVR